MIEAKNPDKVDYTMYDIKDALLIDNTGVFKDQETAKYKKITGQDPDKKAKTKILSRVHKRMST